MDYRVQLAPIKGQDGPYSNIFFFFKVPEMDIVLRKLCFSFNTISFAVSISTHAINKFYVNGFTVQIKWKIPSYPAFPLLEIALVVDLIVTACVIINLVKPVINRNSWAFDITRHKRRVFRMVFNHLKIRWQMRLEATVVSCYATGLSRPI